MQIIWKNSFRPIYLVRFFNHALSWASFSHDRSEGIFGMTLIQANSKVKENHPEYHSKIFSAIKEIAGKIDALPAPDKISLEPIMKLFSQPKKVAICGFEFLRSSVIIFVLMLVCFFSLTLNIKQMDYNRALKLQLYQQVDSV